MYSEGGQMIVVVGGGGGGSGSSEEEAAQDSMVAAQDSVAAVQGEMMQVPMPMSNQLTLSFQGEVYVFDSVPPERVQSVLLLLGGQEEFPSDVSGLMLPNQSNDRVSRVSNNAHRQASLMRYREKRKRLCFDKKILYSVRKEVASRMKRSKGQFASYKTNSEEAMSSPTSSEPAISSSQDDAVQSFCQHCGTSKDCTPMMRRGPTGPRSLCNACGLMWANKGTFRSLPHSSTSGTQNVSVNPNEQSDSHDSDIGSSSHMFSMASSGHDCIPMGGIHESIEFIDG